MEDFQKKTRSLERSRDFDEGFHCHYFLLMVVNHKFLKSVRLIDMWHES